MGKSTSETFGVRENTRHETLTFNVVKKKAGGTGKMDVRENLIHLHLTPGKIKPKGKLMAGKIDFREI